MNQYELVPDPEELLLLDLAQPQSEDELRRLFAPGGLRDKLDTWAHHQQSVSRRELDALLGELSGPLSNSIRAFLSKSAPDYLNESFIESCTWGTLGEVAKKTLRGAAVYAGRNSSSLTTWATKVGLNYTKDRLRQERRNPINSLAPLSESIDAKKVDADGNGNGNGRNYHEVLPDHPDNHPDKALEKLEAHQTIRAKVAQALNRLSKEHRSLVEVFYLLPCLHGADAPDPNKLAAELGIPPGTLASRLHHAKKILQRELAGLLAL